MGKRQTKNSDLNVIKSDRFKFTICYGWGRLSL